MPTVVNAFLGRLSIGLILGSTLLLLALNLSGPPGTAGTLNGYGWSNIYAYHPVFMCLAFLLCFPTAIIAYILDAPAPLAAYLPDKRSRRVLHGACNLLGTLFTIVGFVLAFTYHEAQMALCVQSNGAIPKLCASVRPHAGLDEPPAHATLSRPAHIILGYMVIIAIFLQCCAGLVKYVQRDGVAPAVVPKGGILAQHGRFGPLVWCCGLVCIVLAVYFEYLEVPPADKPHWNAGQLAVACVFIVSLGITVLAYLHTGDRAAHDKSLVDLAGEDDGSVDVRGLLQ